MKLNLPKLLVAALLLSSNFIMAQLPSRVLVGYWHNWEALRLKDVDSRYNVLMLSFLEADKNTVKTDNVVSDLEFTPYSSTNLKADISTVQAQGKKVIVSIGGANGSFKLSSTTDKNTFVSKVKTFITDYKVDGIDLDIEQGEYLCPTSSQTLAAPSAHIQYLIDGVKELLTWYSTTYGKKMILTAAPEVRYTVGATSPWDVCNGAFLPFVEQLRDDLDLLMIQLYNSGSIYSKAGYSWPTNTTSYADGTADFIIVATESAIEGFKIVTESNTDGTYSGLSASKIAIALPASYASATSGYVSTTVMKNAVQYIMGCGSKPGSYTLAKSYPQLKGLMTWSINNDKTGSYAFAQAYQDIFENTSCVPSGVNEIENSLLSVFPNPANNTLTINTNQRGVAFIADMNGQIVSSANVNQEIVELDLSNLASGVYFVNLNNTVSKFVKL